MTDIAQLETARQQLQDRLDAAKTQADRNRLGQFATPPKLASEIIAYAVSMLPRTTRIRFFDPAFGTGSFFSALLRYAPARRIEAAAGFEIDSHYAQPAKQLWKGTVLRLRVADFTNAEPPEAEGERFTLVVCNPPYVRHHHLSQAQKRELRAAIGRLLHFEMNGLSGLYTYFMALSRAWMAKDGVAAWLIPSEFMDVNYGRKVKEFLLERVTLQRIHRFDPAASQFDDALVSSAVVIFKNARPSADHHVEFSFGGTLLKPTVSDSISISELRQVSKWTRLPRSTRQGTKKSHRCTLGDFFTVKRGLATGCNSFFVLTPDRAAELEIPKRFLRPILPSPRELDADEVLADGDSEPQIGERRFLLSCDLPEDQIEAKYPSLWEYIQQGIQSKIHTRYLCRHREPWYSQENRPPAPFLCTYMGRPTRKSASPFRFILNHSNATAANVYLLLYPRPHVASCLGRDVELHRRVWQALSSITAGMLTDEGRIYGGGLHKVEPKELANVPGDVLLHAFPNDRGITRQKALFV